MFRRFLPLFLCALLATSVPVALAQGNYRLQRPADSPGGVSGGGSQFVVQTAPRAAPMYSGNVSASGNSGVNGNTSFNGNTGLSGNSRAMLELGRALVGSFATQPRQVVQPPVQNMYSGNVQETLMRGSTAVFAVPTAAELRRISSRDVVIVIDKSRSMNEADCAADNLPPTLNRFFMRGSGIAGGGSLTRWEWCRRQTMHIASQLARMPGSNLKLVLFDDRVTEFDNVSMESLSDIFNRYKPSGGTNATKALKSTIQDYFERQKFSRTRPLSIVCITDGAPSSPRSLKDLLIDTTIKMNHPGEIAVSFLQIGRDHQGNQLLPELDLGLVPEGARYDIVSVRSFNSLQRTGLMPALLDTARL